jgi:membrane fusion protein (multidrug efflux system)
MHDGPGRAGRPAIDDPVNRAKEDPTMRLARLSPAAPGILVLALLATPAAAQAPGATPPPPSVTVEAVRNQDIAPRSEFIGRMEAIQAVDIRARVQGFLREVKFREGQDLKVGDPLFLIEPEQYQAAVEQAQAQVDSADATLRNAEINLQRRLELRDRNAGSQADLDTATANRDTAKAALSSARAQLDMAKLNLSYTQIASPIAGRIGKAAITDGNLVGPDSTVLARIVQLDPIRAVFSVSERDMLEVQRAAPGATQAEIGASFVPTLRLADGSTYDQKGRIAFAGNEVDPATGTIAIRVEFDNPRALLLPGGTVFVNLQPAQPRLMPVVPVSAVQETRRGKQVLVVGADNKVEVRPITATTQVDQQWAVESGLKAGETIIIDGFQKVRPGAVVTPVMAQSGGRRP